MSTEVATHRLKCHSTVERQRRGGDSSQPGTGEMEEAFFQLYQEFTRLQDLCAKQAVLIQQLIVKKEPMTDMPISMPIQCTDDRGVEQSERLFFRQAPSSVLSSPTISTWHSSEVLQDQPRYADGFSHSDIKYRLKAGNNSLFSSGNRKADFAMVFTSQHRHQPDMGKKADRDTLLKNYMMFPALKADKEKSTDIPIPQALATLDPACEGSFPAFLDLYEAPQDLQVESTSIQKAEIKIPIEIRGPMQTSWTPGWVGEDSPLGHSGILNSKSPLHTQMTCDFCQAVFPVEDTAQDYLKHLIAHVE